MNFKRFEELTKFLEEHNYNWKQMTLGDTEKALRDIARLAGEVC